MNNPGRNALLVCTFKSTNSDTSFLQLQIRIVILHLMIDRMYLDFGSPLIFTDKLVALTGLVHEVP